MELSLVNNDPAQTLLVNRDGVPMYNITTQRSTVINESYLSHSRPSQRRAETYPSPSYNTPAKVSDSIPDSSHESARQRTKTTIITRLQRGRSVGRAQIEIGRLVYHDNTKDLKRDGVQLCLIEERKGYDLTLKPSTAVPQLCEGSGEDKDPEQGVQKSEQVENVESVPPCLWTFTGPDGKSYKWQILFRYPVLILDDSTQTPLARYRRAKLGIISRQSRRAFLEIFPAGIDCIDTIVVTFVSFMVYQFPASKDDSSPTGPENITGLGPAPGPELFTLNQSSNATTGPGTGPLLRQLTSFSPSSSTTNSWTDIRFVRSMSNQGSWNSRTDFNSTSMP